MRQLEASRFQRACDADILLALVSTFSPLCRVFYLLVIPVRLSFCIENYFSCMPTDCVSQLCHN
jgi:hypothetical protein